MVLSTAAESVARLAHMRAGVAHALGSINMVDSLANLLLSDADFVRAPAAVALGFMSTVPVLERSLLQRLVMILVSSVQSRTSLLSIINLIFLMH